MKIRKQRQSMGQEKRGMKKDWQLKVRNKQDKIHKAEIN